MRRLPTLLLAALAALALAGGVWQVARELWRGPGEEPNPFEYDLEALAAVPPELLTWREEAPIDLDLERPTGLAVAADGAVVVVGAGAVAVWADGRPVRSADLPEPATAVAVAGDGRIYVALADHLEVRTAELEPAAAWPAADPRSFLTGVAVVGDTLVVADAGARKIHRYRLDGEPLASWDGVGGDDPDGFVVPSPHFDLALGFEGDLWVTNPGRHLVQGFAGDGRRRSEWGSTGLGPADFSGCCNPTHLAVLPDGAFVTAEKGLERVKVYRPTGELESVVAGREAFTPGTVGLDLAVDSAGRVLVLDPRRGQVRIFSRKEAP